MRRIEAFLLAEFAAEAFLVGSTALGLEVPGERDLDFVMSASADRFGQVYSAVSQRFVEYPVYPPHMDYHVFIGEACGTKIHLALLVSEKARRMRGAIARINRTLSAGERASIVRHKTRLKHTWLFSRHRYKRYKRQMDRRLGLPRFEREPLTLAGEPPATLEPGRGEGPQTVDRTRTVLHTESLTVGPGGQTIRLIEEARRLDARPGWHCVVVGCDGGPLDSELRGSPNYIPFAFPSFRFNPSLIRRAVAVIRETRADVVHTHSSHDAWVFGIAARLARVPVVRGRHVSRPLKHPGIRNFSVRYLADAFTVSGATVGWILVDGGMGREDQIFDTGGGFDPSRFDAARRDRGFLRRELGLSSDATVVGAACAVRPTKGVDVLVDAFARLRRKAPDLDVHLVLAGAVSDDDRDILSARAPGRIHFLGFRPDVERVIGGLDLLVMPSRAADGLPQVIPQAMALRVPVLGTRAGGIPDAVTDLVTGFLVEPENPERLARRIAAILRLEVESLDLVLDRAQHHALERRTFDRIVDTYVEAYLHVLGVQRRSSAMSRPNSSAAMGRLRGAT